MRKLLKYQALAGAILQHRGSLEWEVKVLPWVVGVRGVIDAAGIQRAMHFMDIPAAKRQGLLRKSATASVDALAYIHKVRNSGASKASIRAVSDCCVAPAHTRSLKRRQGPDNAANCMERWKRLATNPMHVSNRCLI